MKYQINVNMQVTTNHRMTIETNKCFAEVDNVLDEVQKKSNNLDDVKILLKSVGCNIIDSDEEEFQDCELEIDELEEVEED